MGSTEEPERKRRHTFNSSTNNTNSISPPLKKPAVAPSPDEKKVDAVMLQFQNQKLSQQLDFQRTEIHALETKFSQLRSKQADYDNNLASIQNAWEELVENLELLAVRANAPNKGSKVLESCPPLQDCNKKTLSHADSVISSVPPEETFLRRLLETGATESSSESNGDVTLERALKARRGATIRTLEHLVQAIDTQRAKNEELFQLIRKGLSTDEAGQLLQKIDDDLRTEIGTLRSAMNSIHLKHSELASEVRSCHDIHARDQVEIKRLAGELEETLADLETSRRKLAALRSQKDAAPSLPGSMSGAKSEAGDKAGDKPFREFKELETALEEAKILASRRLSELREVQQEKLLISEQLLQMQDSVNDEQRILSSRSYLLLNDQIQHLKIEVERYQSLVEQSQAERDGALCREKEANLKAEAGEAAQRANTATCARIAELESKLQQCMGERNDLQVQLEELSQASECKDEVAEFRVMVSTLHKEMRMMQQQLNKYKEAACGAHSLRAEAQSIAAILDRKTSECKSFLEKVADQALEIKSLKDEVRLLRESEQELKLILDMYGHESTDLREIRELKQAECRAWAQVERLKAALDEHSLELRVKAANEAEAACQQRLATAEAEIAELRQKLDSSERVVLELNEVIRMKSEEGDAYLSEIETIGQAYEDMQTQNQRLLQQISERDDYNIKLVSESVKAKQLQTSLLEEKQVLASRIHHVTSLAESHKQRVARLEEQVRTYFEQLGKAADESRQYAAALETSKRKSAEIDKESLLAKSALEVTQKELEQRRHKMADIQAELEKERFEKKRVQEELATLSTKAARLIAQSEGGALVEKLQEEIKEYKAILKCSVCHDRPKEVVITKCFHLFCSPCIQRNLEIRHRKCPGCGVPFGQNDVRNVYI